MTKRAIIRAMWLAGEPAKEIAAAADCSTHQVYTTVRSLGLPSRGRPKTGKWSLWTTQEMDLVEELLGDFIDIPRVEAMSMVARLPSDHQQAMMAMADGADLLEAAEELSVDPITFLRRVREARMWLTSGYLYEGDLTRSA